MKNSANPAPAPNAAMTSLELATWRCRGGCGAMLTMAIASSAQPTPSNREAAGRSPLRRPTTTGMAAEVTPVTGATTVIAPADRAR